MKPSDLRAWQVRMGITGLDELVQVFLLKISFIFRLRSGAF